MKQHLLDWKLWFSVGLCGLVAVTAFYVNDAIHARDDAVRLAERTIVAQVDLRERTERRVETLNERISFLSQRLNEANTEVAEAGRDIRSLEKQVKKCQGANLEEGADDEPKEGNG